MVLRDNPPRGFSLSTVSLVLLSLWLGPCLMPTAAGQSRPINPQSASSPVDQLMQEGQNLAAQGRLADAELAPENYALLTLLGKIEGRVGKHADAIALFRRVVSGQPKSADAHVNLAIALADAGQLEEALNETSTAALLSPKSASVHVNRARLLADLHRPEEAEKEFSIANQLA